MTELEELLDMYSYEWDIYLSSYDMMGRMLDRKRLKERVKKAGISEAYIYGGGYLGIQLYNAVNSFINVLSVVDKSGRLLVDVPGIPVISLDEFKLVYKNQKVIITSVKHYKAIYEELSAFVPEDRLLYLGELLGGIW